MWPFTSWSHKRTGIVINRCFGKEEKWSGHHPRLQTSRFLHVKDDTRKLLLLALTNDRLAAVIDVFSPTFPFFLDDGSLFLSLSLYSRGIWSGCKWFITIFFYSCLFFPLSSKKLRPRFVLFCLVGFWSFPSFVYLSQHGEDKRCSSS